MKLASLKGISLLVAFSGMLMELCFAHFLSAILGGTLLQYSLTIGIFTFALGVAALVANRFEKMNFLVLQSVLLVFCVATVLLFVWILRLQSNVVLGGWVYLAYLPVLFIGLITGLEFPILASGRNETEVVQIMAVDYLGMFFATIAYPLFFLPELGVIQSIAIALASNLSASLLWWSTNR